MSLPALPTTETKRNHGGCHYSTDFFFVNYFPFDIFMMVGRIGLKVDLCCGTSMLSLSCLAIKLEWSWFHIYLSTNHIKLALVFKDPMYICLLEIWLVSTMSSVCLFRIVKTCSWPVSHIFHGIWLYFRHDTTGNGWIISQLFFVYDQVLYLLFLIRFVLFFSIHLMQWLRCLCEMI